MIVTIKVCAREWPVLSAIVMARAEFARFLACLLDDEAEFFARACSKAASASGEMVRSERGVETRGTGSEEIVSGRGLVSAESAASGGAGIGSRGTGVAGSGQAMALAAVSVVSRGAILIAEKTSEEVFLCRVELPLTGILLPVVLIEAEALKVVGGLILEAVLLGNNLIGLFRGEILEFGGLSEARLLEGDTRFGIFEEAEGEVMDWDRWGRAGTGGCGPGRDFEAVIG